LTARHTARPIGGIAAAKGAPEAPRRPNDVLAAETAKRPARFVGVAALPMQEPEIATQELERCINDLGFIGALVNDYSQTRDPQVVVHYDGPRYRPFWRTVERLDVPFYLHPRPPSVRSPLYAGHSCLIRPTV